MKKPRVSYGTKLLRDFLIYLEEEELVVCHEIGSDGYDMPSHRGYPISDSGDALLCKFFVSRIKKGLDKTK